MVIRHLLKALLGLFQKIDRTDHPPLKPIMIWDGECSFCRYWVNRWQRTTRNAIDYVPYQIAHEQFPDLDVKLFYQASRLIDTDGKVFSGPNSAYRSLYLVGKYKYLNSWYENSTLFRRFNDRVYQFIAKHRDLMFRFTKALWGSDPHNIRPFWIVYIGLLLYLIYII